MTRVIKLGLKQILVLCVLAICTVAAVFFGYKLLLKALHPIKYTEIVEKYSEEYGVDSTLIYAVINVESSFNSNAVSSAGAVGLMQITPETFEWLQTKTPEDESLPSDALFVPENAIHYGTLLLSLHLEEFGDTEAALAAYHAGRGQVNRWLGDPEYSQDGVTLYHIPFGDTRRYVSRVNRALEYYQGVIN